MSAFMDGYRAALEDMDQALENITCRCAREAGLGKCLIYREDMEVMLEGALRGCTPEPP